MNTTQMIVNTEIVDKEGNLVRKEIKIKETLQNVYDHYVEKTASSLYAETTADMKEIQNMRRYEATSHLTRIFGLGWKCAELVMSYLCMGNMPYAEKTVVRRLLA